MKISDIIEQFIIDILGDSEFAEISRNELASHFCCAPSQINYVLQTRFTLDRGFEIESRRGGGGYIRIIRLDIEREPFLYGLLESTNEPVSYTRILQIAENLENADIITKEEAEMLTVLTSEKALASPVNSGDMVRSNILRQFIIHLIKR